MKRCYSTSIKSLKLVWSNLFPMLSRHLLNPSQRKGNAHADIISVLLVANTSDYVSDTLDGLEQRLKDCVGEEYADRVKLQDIKEERYGSLTVKALQHAMGFIINALDPYFKKIPTSRDWSQVTEVSDQTSYVAELKNVLQIYITTCHDMIGNKY
eukprot:UN02043